MYGWRARIGILLPSVNGTMEKEMWQMAPDGVTMYTSRFASGSHGTPENLRAMEEESKAAALLVADGQPNAVIYGCTSGSFFEGAGWDKRISRQLEEIVKAPTITTSGAMVDAIRSSGLRKVDVVTPYVALTNERLVRFLNDSGIEVGTVITFDMLDLFAHAKIQPSEIYERTMQTSSSDSSGVFIACTQLRAIEVIDVLERDLRKPVLSANQVSAWWAFKTLGIDPQLTKHGSLMRNLPRSITEERAISLASSTDENRVIPATAIRTR